MSRRPLATVLFVCLRVQPSLIVPTWTASRYSISNPDSSSSLRRCSSLAGLDLANAKDSLTLLIAKAQARLQLSHVLYQQQSSYRAKRASIFRPCRRGANEYLSQCAEISGLMMFVINIVSNNGK